MTMEILSMPTLERLNSSNKFFHEAEEFQTFGDRLSYLSLSDYHYDVPPREWMQKFYKSKAWKDCRNDIILRDKGCELGIPGMYIEGDIIVHHMDPLLKEDIEKWNVDKLFNPDNLICCSVPTHNTIHYGDREEGFVERTKDDTMLWSNSIGNNIAGRD